MRLDTLLMRLNDNMGLNFHFYNVLIGKEIILFPFMNETRSKSVL